MFKGILTGLGGRGLSWLYEARQNTQCELVAFVEPNEANRKRAVEQWHVPADRLFTALDEALAKVEADFVLDVTPPAVHHVIAEMAFARKLHVLGEKPLSDDYTTARRMAQQSAAAGVCHMVTQNYRFNDCPRALRQHLAGGTIGQVGQCDVQFYMPWADVPGSHYVTQPYMLINDMMVHHFDLLRFLLDADPVAVQAITWNHKWGWHQGDAAHAIVFEFPGGLHATHVAVGCTVGEHRDYNGDWRFDGSEGSLTWSAGRIWHAHMHRVDEKLRREVFPKPVPSRAQGILQEFFTAIKEKRAPECNPQDNLRSVAMVFAAITSAKEKRRVELRELD